MPAARRHGLRIALYHSLNNWNDAPDAADALERPADRTRFIANTFARIRELVTRFNPIDVLWYDGWWPFDAQGWEAERTNAMVRDIQPHILFNGRNGLPGDFATPESHLGAPRPWRPWEGCLTLNNTWGYHAGDHDWKTPARWWTAWPRAPGGAATCCSTSARAATESFRRNPSGCWKRWAPGCSAAAHASSRPNPSPTICGSAARIAATGARRAR
jgi:alpha-L-fucosidase